MVKLVSLDSWGIQAGHEWLQVQEGQKDQGISLHGAQLPCGPKHAGLERERICYSSQGPGEESWLSILDSLSVVFTELLFKCSLFCNPIQMHYCFILVNDGKENMGMKAIRVLSSPTLGWYWAKCLGWFNAFCVFVHGSAITLNTTFRQIWYQFSNSISKLLTGSWTPRDHLCLCGAMVSLSDPIP